MNPSRKKWLFVALRMADSALMIGTQLWPFYSDVLPPDVKWPVHLTLTLTSIAVSLSVKIWTYVAEK